MLTYRLNNCIDCVNIPILLKEIDRKLVEMTKKQYNNIVFDLNYFIDSCTISDLLNYKRILQFKNCNADYASCYTLDQIASRVKLLTYK